MRNLTYVSTILGAVIFAILFVKHLKYFRKSLFLFDTIGLGLFTMIGIKTGLEAGLSPVICVALGTITASFGGVIRDVLCNEIPVIFRREIYATPSILGGFSFFLLEQLPIVDTYAYAVAIVIVVSIRLLAVKFAIQLPNIYRN